VPVLRVDQPMADKAVQLGKRIGVVATLSTTLNPTSDLVRRRAAVAGKEIELKSVLCEGAFEALMSITATGSLLRPSGNNATDARVAGLGRLW
jgi:hypothetical protein